MKRLIQSIFTLILTSLFLLNNIIFAQTLESGIEFSGSCLKWMWRWCFDYEKMIWIDKGNKSKNSRQRGYL